MKKYKAILSTLKILMFFVLFSCNNNEVNTENLELINQHVENYLNGDLKFEVSATSHSVDEKVFIEIFFGEKFYLEHSSNKVLSSLIVYRINDLLKDYNLISFKYNFKQFPGEPLVISYQKEKINKIMLESKSNPMFVDRCEYTFRNILPNDVFTYHTILEMTNNADSTFNFDGNFWNLLYEYSKPNHDTIINKKFNIFIYGTKFKKFELDTTKLEYFIKKSDKQSLTQK